MPSKSMTFVSFSPDIRAHAIKGSRNSFFVTGDSVGRVHNSARVRIVGRRRECAVRDRVQQPFVFKSDVPNEAPRWVLDFESGW